MSRAIKYHRLGAFIYGFLCGTGLLMIIWGLASIAMLPSTNLMMNVGLTLLGVVLFAGGSCREAYLRGGLAVPSKVHRQTQQNRLEAAVLIPERMMENSEEIEEQRTHAS